MTERRGRKIVMEGNVVMGLLLGVGITLIVTAMVAIVAAHSGSTACKYAHGVDECAQQWVPIYD